VPVRLLPASIAAGSEITLNVEAGGNSDDVARLTSGVPAAGSEIASRSRWLIPPVQTSGAYVG